MVSIDTIAQVGISRGLITYEPRVAGRNESIPKYNRPPSGGQRILGSWSAARKGPP